MEGLSEDVKTCPDCSDQEMVSSGEGQNKDHNVGLEERRLWPLWDLPGTWDTTLERRLQKSCSGIISSKLKNGP